MKKYALAEVFKTLQGEGVNAGRSAVFVRFAGCNLWSGRQETRASDAERTQAHCPLFCDTDFTARLRMSSLDLVATIMRFMPADVVVFTGGEPLLQLDAELLMMLHGDAFLATQGFRPVLAVETNGTVKPKDGVFDLLDHVCVSPKQADAQIVLREGTELKVVFPRYHPNAYVELAKGFKHLLVSPEAEQRGVGVSDVRPSVERVAAEWVMANPPWRLSLQLHKHLGVP